MHQVSIQEAGRGNATSREPKPKSEEVLQKVVEAQLGDIFDAASFVAGKSDEIKSGGNAATTAFAGLILLETERTQQGATDEQRCVEMREFSQRISALAKKVMAFFTLSDGKS